MSNLNRRDFISLGLAATASGVLTACGAGTGTTVGSRGVSTQPPPAVLQSPMPPTGTTVASQPATNDGSLDQFMVLSAILTGMQTLDRDLGRVYYDLFRSKQYDVPLRQFWEMTAGATTLDALETLGVFSNEATANMADTIIEQWYTGTVQHGDETNVVTYTDALAWKALDFTKPHTVCGVSGMWQTDAGA